MIPKISFNEDIKSLILTEEFPCLTFYFSIENAGGSEPGKLLLKNQCVEAEKILLDSGISPKQTEELLSPVKDLQSESLFWGSHRGGVVILRTQKKMVIGKCSEAFPPLQRVGRVFHLTPLLPFLREEVPLYLLDLHLDDARLYRFQNRELTEEVVIEKPDPVDSDYGLYIGERQLRVHSGGRANNEGSRPIFHGHGAGSDDRDRKIKVEKYFQLLDHSVIKSLPSPSTLLAVVGLPHITSMYKRASKHSNLFAVELKSDGSPNERMYLMEAAARALDNIESDELEKVFRRYNKIQSNNLTAHTLEELLPASLNGQIEILFVDPAACFSGNYLSQENKIEESEARDLNVADLYNMLALNCFRTGARIYPLPASAKKLDPGCKAAAILRYPLNDWTEQAPA